MFSNLRFMAAITAAELCQHVAVAPMTAPTESVVFTGDPCKDVDSTGVVKPSAKRRMKSGDMKPLQLAFEPTVRYDANCQWLLRNAVAKFTLLNGETEITNVEIKGVHVHASTKFDIKDKSGLHQCTFECYLYELARITSCELKGPTS